MTKNKISNIQILRGIAVLMVVFSHISQTLNQYELELNSQYISYFGSLGVDIFFIISGFIMVVVTQNKFKNYLNVKNFLFSRFSRIYPLYWIYAFTAFFISVGDLNYRFIETLFLLPQKNTVLAVAWSLIYELYFYLIFALFMLFISERFLLLVSISWGIIMMLFFHFTNIDNEYFKVATSPLILEFIIGIIIANYYLKLNNNIYISFIILFFHIVIIYIFKQIFIINSFWFGYFIEHSLVASFIVFVFLMFKDGSSYLNKSIEYIGDISYGIYLSHIFQLIVLVKVFNYFEITNIYFIIFTMLISVLIYGVISYKYIEKPLILFTRKLYK